MLVPGSPAPVLSIETLGHGRFTLAEGAPVGGTFVAFHRGRHCKWMRRWLKELDDRIGDFALRGVRVIAVSGESAETARALKEEMQLIRLPIGYALDVAAAARDWGLCLTEGSSEEGAPALHLEPAQVWVRRDGAVGLMAVQSGPNLWSDMNGVIRALETTKDRHPERGGARPEGVL